MKVLIKFVAVVTAIFVLCFLVAQLIHAVDLRTHQTHSSSEPRTRSTAFSATPAAHAGATGFSSTAGSAAAGSVNKPSTLAGPPAVSLEHSSTGAPQSLVSLPVSSLFDSATVFAVTSADDILTISDDSGYAGRGLEADRSEGSAEASQERSGAPGDGASVEDERLIYSTFTPASAPSRPLCRALTDRVSSEVEYGAEGSDEDEDSDKREVSGDDDSNDRDLRAVLRVHGDGAVVDRAEMHVRIAAGAQGHCLHSPHHTRYDFDSADERYGLTNAAFTYGMASHQHGKNPQHWEKLINFLAHTPPHCAQVAFTLHQRKLACTTAYQPLQLPSVDAETEGASTEIPATGGHDSRADAMQQSGHEIVSLINSLASIITSAGSPTLPPRAPDMDTYHSGAVTPTIDARNRYASPCSNVSFTSTARLINPNRIHLLYTPSYHHAAVRKVEVVLRNVSGAPFLTFRPYSMSLVRHSHMPVYRAVLRMGWQAGRTVRFDYMFRVTLRSERVTCMLPGGHFSSNSQRPSVPPQPFNLSSHPPSVAQRCPVTDVFNISAHVISSSVLQSGSDPSPHTYKLVLTSHKLRLDWVHVHLFVNASTPAAITEGRFRMSRAFPAQTNQQPPSSNNHGSRWENTLGEADAQSEVEYAFTYHFNGSSCDTTGRVSTLERLLMDKESVGPDEQLQSLFHVLGMGENTTVVAEPSAVAPDLMHSAHDPHEMDELSNAMIAGHTEEATPQTVTLAATAPSVDLHADHQLHHAAQVSIDALGNIVPFTVPYDATQHTGIGPVVLPPYHQYQPQQPSMHSSNQLASPLLHQADINSVAPQQAAFGGGSMGEPMQRLEGGGCASHDFACQVTAMCRPCIDHPHAGFCASCSHLAHCRSEECAHAATCRMCHDYRMIPLPLPRVCHDLC